jgi:hypothetical protein
MQSLQSKRCRDRIFRPCGQWSRMSDLSIGDRLVSTLDHTLEPKASSVRRLEVLTGTRRRRRFSDDDKTRIIEETWRRRRGVGCGASTRSQSTAVVHVETRSTPSSGNVGTRNRSGVCVGSDPCERRRRRGQQADGVEGVRPAASIEVILDPLVVDRHDLVQRRNLGGIGRTPATPR